MIENIAVILAFFAGFVVLLAVTGLKIVRHSETMVIERLGRFHRVLESGINVIWPLVDRPRKLNWRYIDADAHGKPLVINRVTDRIDLRETVYDFPKQNVITKDNVNIKINAMVYFQVTDPAKGVYEINNLPDAIEKLTQTTLRNVIGELDLDETLTSRDTINKKLVTILDEATNKWGVKVNRVELQDISPPQDIQEAMEKQMRAERDRRAAILTAEGEKRAAILQAEGIKESEINRAEGDKQAEVLRAEGEMEALKRIAEGNAQALEEIKRALGEAEDPARFVISLRYIEALKHMTDGDNNKTVYMPYEATGVLGAVGGIKDLLKSPAVSA